jgi:RNA polymerase-binding protein DksA
VAAAKAPAKKAPAKKAPTTKLTAKALPAKAAPAKSTQTATRAAPPAPAPPVSEWTRAELAVIRKQLFAELTEMGDAYDRSLRDLNDLQKSSTDGAGDDQADAGSKTFEREQEQSIAANRLDLLTQIQRAVERIDAGTYGFCESCGKPIPKARLRAFPSATLDIACKQREERR